MRWIAILCVAWCVLTAASGLWGHRVVREAIKSWHADELRRTMAAVAELASIATWSTPWENDPRWIALERQLTLDLVPIRRADAIPESSSSHGAVADWSESADGQWRVSLTLPVHDNSRLQRVAIRGTRVVSPSIAIRSWWRAWSVSAIVGGLAFAMTIAWRTKEARRWSARLLPWYQATHRNTPAEEATLPSPKSVAADEVELQLEHVREVVNGWLAELQQTSHHNGLVLDSMLEGVLAVDERSRVWLVNSALRKMLEISSENAFLRPLVEVLRAPRVVQLVTDVLTCGIVQEDLLEIGTASRRFLRMRAYPLPLPGNANGVVLTVRDETQLHQGELIRRDFVTNASHELKTPLAAIRAYAETLQLGALTDPPAAEKFVTNIISQADRMDRLVKSMLQLARVQSGTQSLDIREFEAVAALQATIEAVGGLSTAKGVSVSMHSDPQRIPIRSDLEAFQTVTGNLLSNAIRYTPSGGAVEVNVSLDADWVNVVVSDTGVGIPEEDQQRIFERFYRVEKDRNDLSGGTGLGLSIVKHLVQALNGTISLTSRVNVGSSFLVRLPVTR